MGAHQRTRYSNLHTVVSALCVAALFFLWSGCSDNTLVTDAEKAQSVGVSAADAALSKAAAARRAISDDLLDRDGIEGIGTRLNPGGQPQLVVYARSAAAAAAANIPSHVQGVPTSLLVTGLIMARSDETSKARPAPIGFSVGHPDITAGTIGARVKSGDHIYILSNNHVIANSNDANIGDNTLQPGPFDGGTSADVIGTLADFEPISFSDKNVMDAAIALVDGADLDGATPADEGYGAPSATTATAELGMLVQKYGRTTGHTRGEVAEINVTVDVCYTCANPVCTRCAESARFVDQIGISDGTFSDGGDSGSLIVTEENKNPVGLLFAGGGDRTFANPIEPVLARFNVTIDPTTNDGGGSSNSPPTASFTNSCQDLTCDFDGGASSDDDGTIASYDWDFGDGSGASGETASHTYSDDGTYTVTLTVTDDEGATDAASQSVSVSGASGGGGIALSTSGYKVRGLQKADLTWSGASSTNVDVYREGSLHTTTADDGAYTDNIDQRGGGSYTYQVCEAGTTTCSNTSTVTF